MCLPFLAFFFCQLVFPGLKIFYFAPFMATVIYRCSYITALWMALAVGLIVDVFISHPFFGMHAFAYSLAGALLYKLRHHFFSDRWSTFVLMTFCFSLLATLFLWVFSFSLGGLQPMSFGVWWSDFVMMPLVDAAFGVVCFLLPQLWSHRRKIRAPCSG